MRVEIDTLEVTAEIVSPPREDRRLEAARMTEELRRDVLRLCADAVRDELRRRSER